MTYAIALLAGFAVFKAICDVAKAWAKPVPEQQDAPSDGAREHTL